MKFQIQQKHGKHFTKIRYHKYVIQTKEIHTCRRSVLKTTRFTKHIQ